MTSISDNFFLAEQAEPQSSVALATVYAVSGNTARLTFDGSTVPSTKYYKCNKALTFKAGDRVKVCKISGTYIVEYPI